MDAEFWLKRWQEGATGFHMPRATPLLTKFWPTLGVAPGARVLVPLCGKSLDMIWLASQGYEVLGIELAPLAVEQFFAEHGLHPRLEESAEGRHYITERIEIICGDIFNLDAGTLKSCEASYDRGALVALPPPMRQRYVKHVYEGLAKDYRALLLCVEYDQSAMEGPPFSVGAQEVHDLFGAHTGVSEIARMDIIDKEPKFAARGLTRFESVTWRLGATPAP